MIDPADLIATLNSEMEEAVARGQSSFYVSLREALLDLEGCARLIGHPSEAEVV